jgi:hypothetical protein
MAAHSPTGIGHAKERFTFVGLARLNRQRSSLLGHCLKGIDDQIFNYLVYSFSVNQSKE